MKQAWWKQLGPGLLVAATGVGAGDLATAAFSGNQLGLAVLWAVILGAAFKFVINEGLARWQLATGTTVLEGAAAGGPRIFGLLFLPYLFVWSFFVGSALMSACGAASHALFPVFDDPVNGKRFFGVLHGLLGLVLVLRGGFAVFERVMSICIGLMFAVVTVTAILLKPDLGELGRGLVLPSASCFEGDGLSWTIALIGGVGGTLTILCYGYWIREKGRAGPEKLPSCRLDLAVAYGMTAVFGVSMVVIGNEVQTSGKGASLIVDLAEKLEGPLGPVGRWAFLVGAWGAVFSSLLGVWQSVPFVFADTRRLIRGGAATVCIDATSRAYRAFLLGLCFVPMIGLRWSFKEVQKWYAIVGAAFVPMLAILLLFLLRRPSLGRLRSGRLGSGALVATIAFFVVAMVVKLVQSLS